LRRSRPGALTAVLALALGGGAFGHKGGSNSLPRAKSSVYQPSPKSADSETSIPPTAGARPDDLPQPVHSPLLPGAVDFGAFNSQFRSGCDLLAGRGQVRFRDVRRGVIAHNWASDYRAEFFVPHSLVGAGCPKGWPPGYSNSHGLQAKSKSSCEGHLGGG